MSPPARTHLLHLLPGERFRLGGPEGDACEVIELPPSAEGGDPAIAVRLPAGQVISRAEAARLNGGSYFVETVPSLTPPPERSDRP